MTEGAIVPAAVGLVRLEEPVPLSESVIWDLWKQVPGRAFSHAFLARAFARTVRTFFRDTAPDPDEPLAIVDLEAGTGHLGFAFLQAWAELDDAPALCYILAGPDENAIDFWQGCPQLMTLAERGRLDFAVWDVAGRDAGSDESVPLILRGAELRPRRSPLVVIADDAFASARQDAFAVLDGRLLECRLTFDAPAEMAGAGELHPEALRCGHDYRPVDLPYYDDDVLDGLLREYRRELSTGHVLLPVGAFRALRRVAKLAEGGLLLLNAGRGPVHLEDLHDTPPPWPVQPGGVALPVNFHALSRQVEALGGRVFKPRTTPPYLAVNAYLFHTGGDGSATRESLDHLVGGIGPSATDTVLRQLEKSLDETALEGVLAYLKLSGWDSGAGRRALPRLHSLAEGNLVPRESIALADAAERIWAGHLHQGEAFDLSFELGTVVMAAGLHRRAIAFFRASLEGHGAHTATFFNLASCHLRLGEPDLARQCLERSLELDPDNDGARQLGSRIANADDRAAWDAKPAVKDVAPALDAYGSNLEHLRGELALLNLRLRKEVERWRSTHPPAASLEELKGSRLTDVGADVALDSLALDSLASELLSASGGDPIASLAPRTSLHRRREKQALAAGTPLRLPELAGRLGLDDFERAILLLALAPELDERYERLFGYLNDDMQRRWPTVRLALRLFTAAPEERSSEAWKLDPQAPLSDRRLLRCVDPEGPFPGVGLSRGLRLESRTLGFLLDRPAWAAADPVLAPYLETDEADDTGSFVGSVAPPQSPQGDGASAVVREINEFRDYMDTGPEPPPILSLDGPDALLLRRSARFLVGRRLLVLRGTAVATASDPVDLVARALREVELEGLALLVEDAAALGQEGAPTLALDRLLRAPCSSPRLLAAAEPWLLPETCRTAPVLSLHVPAPDEALRVELWRQALGDLADGLDLGELAGRFRLRWAQIDGAARHLRARLGSHPKGAESVATTLYAACRTQCLVSLEGLAERLESVHGWDDLVVPPSVKAKLRGIESWLCYRHVVHHQWGFAERINAGRGMAVLFAGSSGTGKTMAAGILGRTLDLDLYRIDLSSVVSKYIGETEKNLAKIFEAAEASNAILFFDEADALFGKRSQVRDSHDRHANVEVSYLLQRMEQFEGIAILATNLTGNLDTAFARRLQVSVEFPFPSTADRERIWRRLFPEQVPQAEDVDLEYLAKQFALSGGSVKNCALAAALMAATETKPVEMRHLVAAVAREYEKLGKPVTQAVFGAWGQGRS